MVRERVWLIDKFMISIASVRRTFKKFSRTLSKTTIVSLSEYPMTANNAANACNSANAQNHDGGGDADQRATCSGAPRRKMHPVDLHGGGVLAGAGLQECAPVKSARHRSRRISASSARIQITRLRRGEIAPAAPVNHHAEDPRKTASRLSAPLRNEIWRSRQSPPLW